MTVRALLLDLDDTLVDTPRAMRAAVVEATRAHASISDRALLAAIADRWLADASGHFHRYESGEITFVEQRRARFDEIMALAGATGTEYIEWDTYYVDRLVRGVRPYADTMPFLDALDGMPIAVVTNVATEVQRRKLLAAGLAERLPIVVGVDVAGAPKPDPAPFLHACSVLGAPPGDAVHIGDSLIADVAGALGAGLGAIWLDRRAEGSELDVPPGAQRVRTLVEAASVLRATGLDRTSPDGYP